MNYSTNLYSPEAEEALLGSVLINPDCWAEVRAQVKPEDLYLHKNRWVYDAITALKSRDEPVDLLTVRTEMERHKTLDTSGGDSYLAQLINSVPTSLNAGTYAQIVRRESIRRKLMQAATAVAKLALEERELKDILADARRVVAAVVNDGLGAGHTAVDSYEAARELFEQVSNMELLKASIIPTGFYSLDLALGGGLEPDTSTVLFGRPGMSKTAALCQIADSRSEAGLVTAFFTKEMSKREITRRIVFRRAKVNYNEFKQGHYTDEEYQRLVHEMAQFGNRNTFYIDDSTPQTTDQMWAQCERIYEEHGQLDFILADHARLFSDRVSADSRRADTEAKRLGIITWNFKQMARSFHSRVIFSAQVNRQVEHRDKKMPTLSDLRDSGEIEENADIAIAMLRPWVYSQAKNEYALFQFCPRKMREGPTDSEIEMSFVPEFQSFERLAP